ncbi:K05592 deaD, cshA; ATP-dependent RNA helicase DeaD [Candidatus Pelagibacterales bacterium]
MINFEGFSLSQNLKNSLARMNFTAPTPIQVSSIPLALEGRDILGSAQTGTGKTAAFSIPLVELLSRSKQGSALVLTPTRELANQVIAVIIQLLGKSNPIKAACLIGGESMHKQLGQLKSRPRIIVGTPGRINDHLDRKSLKLSDTGFLVLDETDRMLDMGFGIQIDRILKYLPVKKQTLMFSATLPEEIVRMSAKYLKNPERVSMGATNVPSIKIKQEVIHIKQEQKYQELIKQLQERTGSILVFVKTKHNSKNLAAKLCKEKFKADALHGNLRQSKRTTVMSAFRNKKFTILVATDIAARGLDVPHIEHVINYDLPQVAEDYIHRMGRTARAGAEGSSLSFITNSDREKWNAIERLLDPTKKKENFSKGRSGSGGFQRDYKNKRRGGGGRDRNRRGGGSSRPIFGGNRSSEGFRGDKPTERSRDNKHADRFRGSRHSEGFKPKNIEAFKEYKPREGGEKDYRRKSEREKPKFFSKKSKEFKDRDFNTGNKKKYKNKESFN